MKQFYADIESDFYSFMKRDGLGAGARANYISWLRFIDDNDKVNKIDSTITDNMIEQIVDKLKNRVEERNIYQTKRDISNFKSALNKFKNFVEKGVDLENLELELEKRIQETTELDITDIKTLILARRGQGLFRQRIIKMFDSKCVISDFAKIDILVASHIKPWSLSSNKERLDENNGILFLPTYDKLFDKGYFSFNDDGVLIFSELLEKADVERLNIKVGFSYRFNKMQLSYLKFHFENKFLG